VGKTTCKRLSWTHPYLIPYTITNPKWIKDLNVKPEIMKLFEEIIGEKLRVIGLNNGFFGYYTKSS
jgi:hypothetical protein